VSGEGVDGRIKTVKTVFRLIHVNLGCALHGSTQVLPKWYAVCKLTFAVIMIIVIIIIIIIIIRIIIMIIMIIIIIMIIMLTMLTVLLYFDWSSNLIFTP